jgi:hypothetical protein
LFTNLYFLLVFGDDVEGYLDSVLYLLVLLLSTVPLINASGGISGLILVYGCNTRAPASACYSNCPCSSSDGSICGRGHIFSGLYFRSSARTGWWKTLHRSHSSLTWAG